MAQLQDPSASLGLASSQAFLDELCGRLHGLSMQGSPTNASAGLGNPLLASMQPPPPPDYGVVNVAGLGGTAGLLDPTLQQLATLQALQQQQQQQSLGVPGVTADNLLPLLNLSNLLAAQRLSSNVQEAAELLAFKDGLRQGALPPHSTTSSGQRGSGPLHNPLYKTELCRSWEEIGSCRYGAKCQFAHGREELRPVQRHPKYKTEVCRTFAQTGTCPYGTRCRFIHHDATLASLKGPASRGSSASSLNNLMQDTPRSPSLPGLAIPGTPFSPVPLGPLSPSPSMTFAPGGALSPPTPSSGTPAPSSTAAAAAALASLLSAAANVNAAANVGGNASTMGRGNLSGLGGGAFSTGSFSPSALAALGLGTPGGPFLPSGDLPSLGGPMGGPVGPAMNPTPLAAPTPLTIPCPSTLLPASLGSSGGLASAPATPTATHSGSRVARRISLEADATNHRLPIFARLGAEKEGGEGGSASPAPGLNTAGSDSSSSSSS